MTAASTSPPALRMKRKPTKKDAPSLTLERELWATGHDVVVGIDEVGRGAWAGPLTVGAAVLPQDRRGYKGGGPEKAPPGERGGGVGPGGGGGRRLAGGPPPPGGGGGVG